MDDLWKELLAFRRHLPVHLVRAFIGSRLRSGEALLEGAGGDDPMADRRETARLGACRRFANAAGRFSIHLHESAASRAPRPCGLQCDVRPRAGPHDAASSTRALHRAAWTVGLRAA